MNFICRLIVLSIFAAALATTIAGCTYHEHYHMGVPETVIEK